MSIFSDNGERQKKVANKSVENLKELKELLNKDKKNEDNNKIVDDINNFIEQVLNKIISRQNIK